MGKQDVDLYVNLDREVLEVGTIHNHGNGPVDVDFKAETPGSRELVEITPDSFPPLQEGEYFIGISNCGGGDELTCDTFLPCA